MTVRDRITRIEGLLGQIALDFEKLKVELGEPYDHPRPATPVYRNVAPPAAVEEPVEPVEAPVEPVEAPVEPVEAPVAETYVARKGSRKQYSKAEWIATMRRMERFTSATLADEMGVTKSGALLQIVAAEEKGTIQRHARYPRDHKTYYTYVKPEARTVNREKNPPPEVEMRKKSKRGETIFVGTGRGMSVAGTGKTAKPTNNQEILTILKAVKDAGWAYSDAGKHIKITTPDGGVVAAPRTPSDHRSIPNLKAELRRKGLAI